MPATIGELTSLKELHLHSNQLTALPETIRTLESLEEFSLNDNNLTTIPTSIKAWIEGLKNNGCHVET